MTKEEIKQMAWEVASEVHEMIMEETDGEPLDGDETEYFTDCLLIELDKLNGND